MLSFWQFLAVVLPKPGLNPQIMKNILARKYNQQRKAENIMNLKITPKICTY